MACARRYRVGTADMLDQIVAILARPITERVDQLSFQIGGLMATVEEIRDQLAAQITETKTSLDAAISRVQEDVAELQRRLDVPPETFQPVTDGLAGLKSSLDALDPLADFPAPEPPPASEPPPEPGT